MGQKTKSMPTPKFFEHL